MADRSVRIITKQTAVPGRVPTGTTGNEQNFIRQGEMAQNTADKKLFGYDGSNIFEFGVSSYLGLTGGTVTGNTRIIGSFSADTLFSGSTNLYDIFLTAGNLSGTSVSAGSNIIVQQTGNDYKVSVVNSPSFNQLVTSGSVTIKSSLTVTGNTNMSDVLPNSANTYDIGSNALRWKKIYSSNLDASDSVVSNSLYASVLSADTIYSGSTNLYSIFAQPSLVVNNVNAGSNITTGGTAISPIINLVASPSVNNITFSGTAIGGTVQAGAGTFTSLSATTLSGGTILSGNTNLYNIFQPSAGTLKQKNGSVTGTTFSGNPKKVTVTFATAFPDNNYAVTITGEISRSWSIESKSASGFVINANANAAFTNNVFWMAGQIGESI